MEAWLDGKFPCPICGMPYHSQEEAEVCAAKGVQENTFSIGDLIQLLDGSIVAVTGLLEASHIDHVPGITFDLPDHLLPQMGLTNDQRQQIFDIETAEKRRIR